MQPYAVVKTGGKQYTVRAGDELKVELIPGKSEGDSVELVTLAMNDGNEFKVGAPELDAKVKATILREERAKKVIVFKNKRRSTYRRKTGHRQNLIAIRIDSLQ